jgi:hypothetical protein
MAKSSVGEWMSWMMWMIELHVDLGLLNDDRIFLVPEPFMPWTQFAEPHDWSRYLNTPTTIRISGVTIVQGYKQVPAYMHHL